MTIHVEDQSVWEEGMALLKDEESTEQPRYDYQVYPLERAGISLHLDRVTLKEENPASQILLIHGVTYSSHEFDLDYQDYSLVRRLAREGYAVWRLDIAGYGQSEAVEDGFLPDSDYAAQDIGAAVELICQESGQEKIDLLGWSWGTVTTGLYASEHPERLSHLILYAPILTGVGEVSVPQPFRSISWESAADDFQKDESGEIDEAITEPAVVGIYCSNCWRYDRENSPAAGFRDICVSEEETLIDLTAISVPTLVVFGDKDPYLNMDRVLHCLDLLPEGSALEMIPGGGHALLYEKPCYHRFQNSILEFLDNEELPLEEGQSLEMGALTQEGAFEAASLS